MAQPGKLPKKRRRQGAERKELRQSLIKEFRDDKPGAPPTTAERDVFRGLARGDFEEDRAPTSSTPLYDELPTPLRVPPEKLDMKYSGRGDGSAERLDLIRKEVIRNKTLDKARRAVRTGSGSSSTTSPTVGKAKGGMISTKRYMNGGMVMSGRGVRDTKMS